MCGSRNCAANKTRETTSISSRFWSTPQDPGSGGQKLTTAIDNLFLASDYVRTYTDLATMEGANEAARRAVNAILDRTGSTKPRCELWPLDEPAIFAPVRLLDQWYYEQIQHHKPTW